MQTQMNAAERGIVSEFADVDKRICVDYFVTLWSLDWLLSLKQFFINVSYHILVASLTLIALAPVLKTIFHQCVISYTCS